MLPASTSYGPGPTPRNNWTACSSHACRTRTLMSAQLRAILNHAARTSWVVANSVRSAGRRTMPRKLTAASLLPTSDSNPSTSDEISWRCGSTKEQCATSRIGTLTHLQPAFSFWTASKQVRSPMTNERVASCTTQMWTRPFPAVHTVSCNSSTGVVTNHAPTVSSTRTLSLSPHSRRRHSSVPVTARRHVELQERSRSTSARAALSAENANSMLSSPMLTPVAAASGSCNTSSIRCV